MVDFTIRVIIDPSQARTGTRAVRNELGGVESALTRLNRLAAGFLAFTGVRTTLRTLREFGDTVIRVENQLRTVTDTEAELVAVTEELFRISQDTRTAFDANVRLFQRVRIAADELGASQEQLFTFTERVGQALTLFGISSERARGALLQLSQGLTAGVFRAEEFNSILENAFPIAQAAARGFGEAGISVGQLRQRVIDGTLSSTEFFEAFLRGSEELEEQFLQTTPTVDQGITVLNSSLLNLVRRLEESLGAAQGAAAGFVSLSRTIDDLGRFFLPTTTERIDDLQESLAGFRAENPVLEFFRQLAESVGLNSEAFINNSALVNIEEQAQRRLTQTNNNLLATLRQEQRELVGRLDLIIDNTEATVRFTDSQQDVIDDLEFELAQLQRTSRERVVALALRQAETDATDENAEAIRTLALRLFDEEAALERRNEASERAAELAEQQERDREAAAERAQRILERDREALQELQDELDPTAAASRRLNEQLALLGRAEILDPTLTTERVEMLREELERANRLEVLDEQTDLLSGFERGLIRIGESVSDFASTSEDLITRGFEGAQDAFQEFIRTGEFELDRFVQNIADAFLEIGTQQLFAALVGPTGGGGLLEGLLGGIGGGAGGGGGIGGLFGGLAGGLLGFQDGGSFTVNPSTAVGTTTGVDNRLVAFRARDGEQVTVTPPGGGMRPIQVNMTVVTDDADSFNQSRENTVAQLAQSIRRADSRNN